MNRPRLRGKAGFFATNGLELSHHGIAHQHFLTGLNTMARKRLRLLHSTRIVCAGVVVISTQAFIPNAARADPTCTCRFATHKFTLGQVMCIRGKLSRCEMNLNNTVWKIISDTCPEVRNFTPRPKTIIASFKPAHQ